MRRVGLTEKRMQDKRFRKTEEMILKVFFEEDYYVSMQDVAKKIGVARSTVYNHHRAVREILPDYEKYILRKYKNIIAHMLRKKNVKLKTIYTRTLFFIIQEKRIFELAIKKERRGMIFGMVFMNKGKIMRRARMPQDKEKILRIYASEVVELIVDWGKAGFKVDEVEKIVEEMMYLTDTMMARLGPLAE